MMRAAAIAAAMFAASPALAQQPSLSHPDLPVAGTARVAEVTTLRRLVDATPGSDPDLLVLRHRLATELQKSADPAEREEGRRSLEAILVEHPQFARRDDVLYQLALAAQQAGDTLASRKLFKELIQNFPRSSHIAGAFCSFGDFFFDQQQNSPARQLYEKAMQFPGAPAADYALYKLAWVELRETQHQKALELFFRLAKKARQQPAVRAAAQEGLVFAYAPVGKASKAYMFFQRVDRANAAQMQSALADQYAAAGKHAEAIFTYRELLARAPRDVRVCDWQAGVARSTAASASRRAAAKELQRLREVGRRLKRPLCAQLADSI